MKKYFILLLILCLCGCATVGRKFDVRSVDLIDKNLTTKEEIISIFGKPASITTDSEGRDTFFYLHMKAKAKPTSFIPLVWIFSGGGSAKSEALTIYFDKEGIVEDYESSTTDQDLRTGIMQKE